jgi:asparagine synthetase B (glutamine-hydrolysing)
MKPELLAINPEYFHKILNWKNIEYEFVGNLFRVKGFTDYNRILDINSVFSSYPFGDLVDRTNSIKQPFKFKTLREWQVPESCLSFDDVMHNQVMHYVCTNKKLNICWSGGIDSTTMLVAFLKHAPDLTQIRVLYSPFSVYENRAFLELLQRDYPQVETLDISGNVYMDTHFDGILLNGHGGDEFVSSLDDSFYEKVGGDGLYRPWKDYFYEQNNDTKFIEFCENYFAKAGKPIESVLDARWWFYVSNKSQVFQITDNVFLANQKDANVTDTVAFYDNKDFEAYMYFNPQLIIEDRHDYKTHKNFMKRYIFEFDKNEDYFKNKAKSNSVQFAWYTMKKVCMLDLRWVARLSDGSTITTPNLPFFSKKEFEKLYGNSLDYLFNEPDYV